MPSSLLPGTTAHPSQCLVSATPSSEDPLPGDAGETRSLGLGSPSGPWTLTAATWLPSLHSQAPRGILDSQSQGAQPSLMKALGAATHDAPSRAPEPPQRPRTLRSYRIQSLQIAPDPLTEPAEGLQAQPGPGISGRPSPEPHQGTPNRIGHPKTSKPGRVQPPRTKLGAAAPDGTERGAARRAEPCPRAPRLHALPGLLPAPSPREPGGPRVPLRRRRGGPSRRAGRSTHHSSRASLRPRAAPRAPLPVPGRTPRTPRLRAAAARWVPEAKRGTGAESQEAGPPRGQWRGAGPGQLSQSRPGTACPARARVLTLCALGLGPGPGWRADPRGQKRAGSPASGYGVQTSPRPARGWRSPGSGSAVSGARRRKPRRPLSPAWRQQGV